MSHRRNSWLSLLVWLLTATVFTVQSLAHRPYEHSAGTFKRTDGQEISIVRQYIDGIIVADPVSIQFRLSDGNGIAHTDFVRDASVWRRAACSEIYEFKTTLLPIAIRIRQFDG